jgi:manganese/zinc/iron transport system permease protein
MIDFHIYLYGAFFIVVAIFILIFYKEIQVSSFDPSYAKSLGIQVKLIDAVLLFLTVSAVIIGIRSVGVILMSAMLIAPAVAARQFTNRLSILLFWSVFFGAASGFFGNYFSVKLTEAFAKWHPSSRVILPTGPMIVLSATAICLAALLFAPEKGIIARLLRMGHFKCRCLCENIIKLMWKSGAEQATHLNQITRAVSSSYLLAHSLLCLLRFQRLVIKEGQRSYRLTAEGRIKAARIVRLHRLWEVYLAHYLDVSADRVHRNAEEMEHILTPELEQKLTLLLEDPKEDPHKQPIPLREEVYAS